jgi:hypothetical protein
MEHWRQNYSFEYFNLYVCREQMRRLIRANVLPVLCAGKMSPVAAHILRILQHFSPPESHGAPSGRQESSVTSREFSVAVVF